MDPRALQPEPPCFFQRGRTSTGVEVITTVPLDDFWQMYDGARQMMVAYLSGGPDAKQAVESIFRTAGTIDADNRGYAVMMTHLLQRAHKEIEGAMQAQGPGAQQPSAAPPAQYVGGPPPQQQGGGGWAIPSPSVGGQGFPTPQGGGGGGGVPAKSYSRVRGGGGGARSAPAAQPRGKAQAGGVRTQTKVISGVSTGPLPDHIQAQIAAARAAKAPAPVQAASKEKES